METKDKERFEAGMANVRNLEIGMLTRKLEKAKENGDKTITVNTHDAEWIRTALIHHFKMESSEK